MRFSSIRASAVALTASFALAACAGHGIVPSGTSYAGAPTTDLASSAVKKTTSPCLASTLPYKFGGAYTITTLTKGKAATSALPKYKGYTVTTKYAAGTVGASGAVLFCDGTGKTDISGKYKGKSFPFYSDGALYVEAVNTGKTTITLSKTPTIVMTGLKTGDTCTLLVLESTGKWYATPLSTKVKAGKLEYPSLPNSLNFGFPAGTPVFLAVGCAK
ncbi:MAG TPA: hypothetical protein VMH02_09505 [Verrucomicrobiae bacterium]|nr:hypothetical protein [Verrucomicrobiae bacterium]